MTVANVDLNAFLKKRKVLYFLSILFMLFYGILYTLSYGTPPWWGSHYAFSTLPPLYGLIRSVSAQKTPAFGTRTYANARKQF